MILGEPQPSRYDLRFQAFRIPVYVTPWFWVICLFLSGALRNPDLRRIIVWTVAVFASILVHELGHALSGRKFGMRNQRIYLHGMGGLACGEGSLSSNERMLMILAGPGAGFVLGGLSFGALFVLLLKGGPVTMLHQFLDVMIWINIAWSFLNLIPVYPLDGGQFTMTLLMKKNRWEGQQLAVRISFGTAIAVAACGLLFNRELARLFSVDGIFLAILFGYLAYTSYQMMQQMGGGGGGGYGSDRWRR